MPKVTIYLSDDLDAAVKAAGISVSPVCQAALEKELRQTDGVIRPSLAEHFKDQADWRRRVAQDYPDDPRNIRCADALVDLERRVTLLPPDHPLLSVARILNRHYLMDVITPPPNELAYLAISRFWFNPSDHQEPDEFLTWLAQQWAADIVATSTEPGESEEFATEFAEVGIPTASE